MVNQKNANAGCGLTDPSHKDHQKNGAFVTKTECGEPSYAFAEAKPPPSSPPQCSSSGISSCDSDEEGSTHFGIDDDSSGDSSDDDDDDISASIGIKNKKYYSTEHGYNLTAFDQTNNGSWSIEKPLPLPLWNQESKPILVIDKLYAYEDLVASIETTLQHMIQETHYDTANNFIDFYQAFRNSRFEKLDAFFRHYVPAINRRSHMCVSLAMEIISRIALLRPDIAEHFYLVSCEEAVENAIAYAENCQQSGIDSAAWTLEKEHALVAMKIKVCGRDGILLLDPGYHVARVVSVMKDEKYPHTNYFVQSDEPGCKREYCYTFSHESTNYIAWHERTTRNGKQMFEESAIYVGRPFRSAVDVTARRNLVYEFRSLVSRDAKGRVFAGLYFPIIANSDMAFTIFYNEGIDNKMLKTKLRFSTFKEGVKVSNIFFVIRYHL